MDCPRNIAGSASPRFFKNKESPEYRAITLIASTFAHPERPILASFILAAADRDAAAQFLLRETSESDPATLHQFLAKWNTLAKHFRPLLATELNEEQKELVRERDKNACWFSWSSSQNARSSDFAFAYIISPTLWTELGTADTPTDLYPMLEAFIGCDELEELRDVLHTNNRLEKSACNQILLLTGFAYSLFREGRLSLRALRLPESDGTACYSVATDASAWVTADTVSFDTGLPGTAEPPHPLLLRVNHRFSNVLSWLEVAEDMAAQTQNSDRGQWLSGLRNSHWRFGEDGVSHWSARITQALWARIQQLWRHLPIFLRSYTCQRLLTIGRYFYGMTSSRRVHRLPFGLYLRIGCANWAKRHQAEFEALRLVEAYTTVPAPRAIDIFQYQDSSYLLMTRIPGRPIGRMLHRMTDVQLRKAKEDLSEYLTQLRRIPNMKGSGICSASGTGILDWRIGDSTREEMTFSTTKEFHRGITAGYSKDLVDRAQPSHRKDHDIVFTHGDINLRNVLVDGTGTITGIVDWECSGWFPEYWEYTKAHFAVRATIRWLADVVDQLFTGYREELRVENMLTAYAPFI